MLHLTVVAEWVESEEVLEEPAVMEAALVVEALVVREEEVVLVQVLVVREEVALQEVKVEGAEVREAVKLLQLESVTTNPDPLIHPRMIGLTSLLPKFGSDSISIVNIK